MSALRRPPPQGIIVRILNAVSSTQFCVDLVPIFPDAATIKTVKVQNFEKLVLARNSGEIVLILEGHWMKHCRLLCKRKINPMHDHAIVETQDHLVALKNR